MLRIEHKIYLSIPDVMNWLGVGRNTVYRWIDRGLPCRRLGWQLWFPYKEARQWIKAYKGHCPPLR
jgi:predicted DNA-binding transcriptional regulator AlpA